MSNQYTKKEITDLEVNDIVSLYESGMSYSRIASKIHIKKTRVKEILINKGVWVDKGFNKTQIESIKKLYLESLLSCEKIGVLFGVSKQPIKTILKDLGVLRIGYSNGLKIILSEEQKDKIKKLYLNEYKNCDEIAKEMKLTISFIDKYLNNVPYRRSKSEGVSVGLVKRYSDVNYLEYLNNLPEFRAYSSKVLKITRRQDINSLANFEKRGKSGIDGAYHLDHKYSITEGFKNGIKPEIIGNIKNLEFIPWEDNVTKRTKCSITIKQLINNL